MSDKEEGSEQEVEVVHKITIEELCEEFRLLVIQRDAISRRIREAHLRNMEAEEQLQKLRERYAYLKQRYFQDAEFQSPAQTPTIQEEETEEDEDDDEEEVDVEVEELLYEEDQSPDEDQWPDFSLTDSSSEFHSFPSDTSSSASDDDETSRN